LLDDAGATALDAASVGLDLPEAGTELDLDAVASALLREARALREHPIDVNAASLSELLRVPFLGPGTAMRILAVRRTRGPFKSVGDLVTTGVVSAESLALVRPYIAALPGGPAVGSLPARRAGVSGSGTGARSGEQGAATVQGAGSFFAAGERSSGEPSLRWSLRARVSGRGDESDGAGADVAELASTFARLRASYRDVVQFGLVCERDPGESSLADHSAAYVSWAGAQRLNPEQIVGDYGLSIGLGDFTGVWGQGLVMRASLFTAPNAYPLVRDRLRGYDGASETIARRGIFVTLSRGAATASALCARTALDATVGDDGLVSSIRSTGYHRTEGEKSAAGALTERLLGVRVRFEPRPGLEVAASVLGFEFDPPLAPGDPARQHFRFAGSALVVGGADLRFLGEGYRVGIEAARSDGGAAAVLGSSRFIVGGAVIRAGFSYVARDYWSPLGAGAPGTSGGANGVAGWVGLEYGDRGRWRCWIDAVVKGRPWRSYNMELCDHGHGLTFGCSRSLGRAGRLLIETLSRSRSVEEDEPTRTAELSYRRTRIALTGKGEWPVSLALYSSASDLENVRVGELTGFGVSFDRDIAERCSIATGVVAVTRKGDIQAIALYEPGLPGAFSLRALNASGTRWYIRSQVGLLSRAALTARIGGGPRPGQIEIGVGIDVEG
jgi:hypothetical protein